MKKLKHITAALLSFGWTNLSFSMEAETPKNKVESENCVKTQKTLISIPELVENYLDAYKKNNSYVTFTGIRDLMNAVKLFLIDANGSEQEWFNSYEALFKEKTSNIVQCLNKVMELIDREATNFVVSLERNPDHTNIANHDMRDVAVTEEELNAARIKLMQAGDLILYSDYIDKMFIDFKKSDANSSRKINIIETTERMEKEIENNYNQAGRLAFSWELFLQKYPDTIYSSENLMVACKKFDNFYKTASDTARQELEKRIKIPSKDRIINALGIRIDLLKSRLKIYSLFEHPNDQ